VLVVVLQPREQGPAHDLNTSALQIHVFSDAILERVLELLELLHQHIVRHLVPWVAELFRIRMIILDKHIEVVPHPFQPLRHLGRRPNKERRWLLTPRH
jgi:hypothetical protein